MNILLEDTTLDNILIENIDIKMETELTIKGEHRDVKESNSLIWFDIRIWI